MDSRDLTIISFNCKGLKHRNYEYIKKIFESTDILLVQEHWLFDFEDNVFHNVLPNCQFVSKSGMSDDLILTGRPYGGVAIIWKRSCPLKFDQIETTSKRLCAVRVTGANTNFVLLNVYMPCNGNDDEFFNVLCEMNAICNTFVQLDVIIGGDFNCEVTSRNLRASMFYEFTDSNEFFIPSLERRFNIPYTFMNAINQRSLIDHFLVNSRINDRLSNCYIMEDGDNLSDHCPLVLKIIGKLCNGNKQITGRVNASQLPRIRWNDASNSDKENYRNKVNDLLSQIDIPFSAIHCTNSECTIHGAEFTSFLSDIVEVMEISSYSSIPLSKKKNAEGNRNVNRGIIVGWNSRVKKFRDQAIFWHNIWKDCGRPVNGWVTALRRQTRFDYHRTVKATKSSQDSIRREKVAAKLIKGNHRCFWREVGSVHSNPNLKANTIDGRTGKEACNVFKEK